MNNDNANPKVFARQLCGRCRTGSDQMGVVIHGVTDSYPGSMGKALCGKQPGRRSAGWGEPLPEGTALTCEACRRKVSKMLSALLAEE